MTLAQLIEKTGFQPITTQSNLDAEVTGGICCDLLSWVIARGAPGMAWVTVQTHMNVVAVAALHEFSCVILAEGCEMDADVVKKAESQGVTVLSAKGSEYTLSGMLYELGIGK